MQHGAYGLGRTRHQWSSIK